MAKRDALLLLCFALAAAPLTAQTRSMSARAGTVRVLQGRARIDGKPVRMLPSPNTPPQMNNGQRLHVDSGRVEVRLGPGAGVTVTQGATLHIVENHLDDVQVELETGSALIKVETLYKGGRLRVLFPGGDVDLHTIGWYRFEASPKTLRVYQGAADVSLQGSLLKAKKGQAVDLTAHAVLTAFNVKASDPLVDSEIKRNQDNQTRQRRVAELAAMQRARRALYNDERQQMDEDRTRISTTPAPAKSGN